MIERRRDEWQDQYNRWQALKKAKEDKRSITERIMGRCIVQPEPIIQEIKETKKKEEEKKEETKNIQTEPPKVRKYRNYREIIASRRASEKGPGYSQKILEEIEKIDVDLH
jgi:hypothetical protein